MLEIRDLRAGYGLSEVLDGVDLDVPDGTFAAVLGRNGMGKTTLCRSIMALDPPTVTGGTITYDGTDLTGLAPHQVARAGIGYVPQGRHVFPSLDVVKNLTVVARGGGGWRLDRVWDAFPRLAERRANDAGQLSGGEQQMLAIARALMTNPKLLIMDEPSEGLAPIVVEAVAEQLEALKADGGLSLLLVEQNYTLAMRLADVVFVLENGQVVFRGAPEELDADEDVRRRSLGVGV
jgi:branched-chain amino acid transport system ATP-binding protein